LAEAQSIKMHERLDSLLQDCRKQTALFLQTLPNDTASCFEICRRAIAELNEDAW
jgi:hypothetical protein